MNGTEGAEPNTPHPPVPRPESQQDQAPEPAVVSPGVAVRWVAAFLIVLAAIGFWQLLPSMNRYASDIDGLEIVHWEWTEPKMDASCDGNSLIINGKFYSKGIGVHAPTDIRVPVPFGYSHFVCEVGIDDEIADDLPASVQFLILGDGAVLYESPILRAADPPRRVVVPVEGVSSLLLRVNDGGDGNNSDHADWALAHFTNL